MVIGHPGCLHFEIHAFIQMGELRWVSFCIPEAGEDSCNLVVVVVVAWWLAE